jgi:hypothetical protein
MTALIPTFRTLKWPRAAWEALGGPGHDRAASLPEAERRLALIALAILLALGVAARAEEKEPDHIRGQITAVGDAAIELRTTQGSTQRIRLTDEVTILSLAAASFADVDFGVYVGAASEKMDERYSPIFRDSLSWLYRGLELRIIDEKLRGIALGHRKWDLTPVSVMTHGWIDDLEERVMSIKYGPTDQDETDVEIGRDIRVLKMGLGDRSLLKPGAHVFAGANKGADGNYVGAFLIVGIGDVVPGL